MSRPRVIAAAVAALTGACAVGSFVALVGRILEHQSTHQFLQPIFKRIEGASGEYAGRRVELTDDVDDAGEGTVTLRYGDDQVTFPVTIPNDIELPFFQRHEDWLTALRFVEPPPDTPYNEFVELVEAGQLPERLVVVTRSPNPGANDGLFDIDVPDRSWGYGEVMRSHWTFDFYELLPEGGIRHETRTFPESERSFARRVREAEAAGLPRPERDPAELQPRSWQHYAALKVMPRGMGPKERFEGSALQHAGWTLPAAAFSGLAFFLALAFTFAPSRARWSPDEPSPSDPRREGTPGVSPR